MLNLSFLEKLNLPFFEKDIEEPIHREKPGFLGFSVWLIITLSLSSNLMITTFLSFNSMLNSGVMINHYSHITLFFYHIIIGVFLVIVAKGVGYVFDRIPPNEHKVQNLSHYFSLYGVTFWLFTVVFILGLLIIIPFKIVYSTYMGRFSEKKTFTTTSSITPPSKSSHQYLLDIILDKIQKSGYNSLTEEEKDFLFNSSK